MNEIRLMSCPFCGFRRPILLTHKKFNSVMYSVRCDIKNGGCGVETKHMPYIEDVVKAWNTRARY